MAKKKTIDKTTPPKHCKSIKEYEASPYWANKSLQLREDKDVVCAICGRRRWMWQVRNKRWKRSLVFNVHHITYANVPYEKEEDMLVLCRLCHNLSHDLLRYRNISPIYEAYAQIAETVFQYEGKDTFKPW